MNTKYDAQLNKIQFYVLHPEYLPFIGERYDEYRILHVGESHYIGQSSNFDHNRFEIEYFKDWFQTPCEEVRDAFSGWYTTRKVIDNYLNGERRRGHIIFTNMVRTFDHVILNQCDEGNVASISQDYHCFSFMNYFQLPSLYSGLSLWSSLMRSAQKQHNLPLASSLYKKTVETSAQVFRSVLEILDPKLVVFTSKAAFDAYKQCAEDMKKYSIVSTTHPGCPWWNKPMKRYGGLTGKEQLEKCFTVYKSVNMK